MEWETEMKKMLHLLVLLLTFTACTDKKSSQALSDDVSTSTTINTDPDDGGFTPDEGDSSSPHSPSATSSDPITQEFMTLLNNHRKGLGLKALILVEGLSDITREHSEDMANGQVSFGHTGFSNRCSESRTVLGGANLCAENVAMGQKTPLAAFNAWMNSSGHKANMELARATHTGFGYAQNPNGTYYWTQIFLEKN